MKYYDLQLSAPAGHINLMAEIRLGAARQALAHQEKDPKGVIRGGSVGAIINGEIIGECHRKAHLRFEGYGSLLEEETELMTDQGALVEEDIINKLTAAGWTIAKQNELEVPLTVGKLQGIISPDCILKDQQGDVVYGVELKNISGITGARDRHLQLKPDPKHLIQAGNQAIRVGEFLGRKSPLPWALVYTSRVNWHTFAAPKWFREDVEKAGLDAEFGSDGKAKKIHPFIRIYYIGWTNTGKMTYWAHGMSKPFTTEVTKESIDRYYSAVGEKIKETKNLGPRPAAKNLAGDSTYKACDYCSFADICQSHESNYDTWMDYAKTKVLDERNERWRIQKEMETMAVNPMVTTEDNPPASKSQATQVVTKSPAE